MRYAFKNIWGLKDAKGGKEGLVQDLNRLSFLGTISHLRRFNTPLSVQKVREPHSLHATSLGIMCPLETPDGGNIGLRKNLSLLAQITFGSSSKSLHVCFRAFDMLYLHEVTPEEIQYYPRILLNEVFIGIHKDPLMFVRILKAHRRNALINIYTSISWNCDEKTIRINTYNGRGCRPILIASKRDKFVEKINKLNNGENWYDMIQGVAKLNELSSIAKETGISRYDPYDNTYYYPDILISKIVQPIMKRAGGSTEVQVDKYLVHKALAENLEEMGGIIEYIDAEEMNVSTIAVYPNQLYDGSGPDGDHSSKDKDTNAVIANYTHCEIHPTLMFGALASIIPFGDSNQLPRDLFSTGQTKQALSVYTSNYQNRMDTEGQIIYYGHRALVRTRYEPYMHLNKMPCGMTAMVAIISYKGYNQEDSIIANQSSLDRGLYRTTKFKTYEDRRKV